MACCGAAQRWCSAVQRKIFKNTPAGVFFGSTRGETLKDPGKSCRPVDWTFQDYYQHGRHDAPTTEVVLEHSCGGFVFFNGWLFYGCFSLDGSSKINIE
jgi:hypothetical protein